MARHGYVSNGSKAKQKKNIIFFVVSVLVIVAAYAAIKKVWNGQPDEPVPSEPVNMPVVKVTKPQTPPVRTAVPDDGARAVVKPQLPAADVPASPAVPAAPDAAVAAAPDAQGSAAAPLVPINPVKTEEDILGEMITKATDIARAGKIIEARNELYSLMNRYPDSPQRVKIKTLLSELANQWLFSDKVVEGDTSCSYYKVQSGDLLSKIGAKNDVPWELLLKMNKILRPEMLRAGQTIKVVKGPFNAIVSRSTFTMDLYLDDVYVKSYKVGLGSVKHTTPTGLWTVGLDKLISPSWTDPDTNRTYDAADKDYPLGKRWIGLKGVSGEAAGRTGFAIHGTNEPQSIGQRSSRGCIRLADDDILEVYDLMTPGKSQVQVVD